MEFSVSAYEKLLNFLIPRKFDFVASVTVNKVGHKMGSFYGDFTIKLSPKIKKHIDKDCYDKLNQGESLNFWIMAICTKKKLNLIDLEKELEKSFKELTNIKLLGIGIIKTNYIL
jgi:hypothetical protein